MNTIEVRTTTLTGGGAAVGRLADGRVVFVDGAAPDELVRVDLTKQDKRWAKARILEILESSPDRVIPSLPAAALGGASWAHVRYKAQLAAKEGIVRSALERIGKLVNPTIKPIVPSTEQWRYRNRIELTFGQQDGEIILGTLAPGSDTLVQPATDSAFFPDVAADIMSAVLTWARQSGLSSWSPRTRVGELRSLVLRRGVRTNDLLANLVTTTATEPSQGLTAALRGIPLTGILWSANNNPKSVMDISATETLVGKPVLSDVVNKSLLTYHATSFFQSNVPMAERLVLALQDRLGSPTDVVDLYAGVGLLGLVTTGRETVLTLVESHPQSVHDAKRNAQTLDRLSNTTLVEATAQAYVGKFPLPSEATILVDPPRTGLDRSVVDALLRAKSKQLIYVSCDPATLARDLNLLGEKYEPIFIQPFDFFPQTPHVETLVELRAKRRVDAGELNLSGQSW